MIMDIFLVIVVVSFIGGGNRSTQRKPPTCRKSSQTYNIFSTWPQKDICIKYFYIYFWQFKPTEQSVIFSQLTKIIVFVFSPQWDLNSRHLYTAALMMNHIAPLPSVKQTKIRQDLPTMIDEIYVGTTKLLNSAPWTPTTFHSNNLSLQVITNNVSSPLDFDFRGFSGPWNPQKLDPHNNDFTVIGLNYRWSFTSRGRSRTTTDNGGT
jgi:hypothetical protein